jgi:hypothetical protein
MAAETMATRAETFHGATRCRRKFLHLAAGAAAVPAVTRVARAESYPTKPVRMIVGFTDALCFFKELQRDRGPGANAIIAPSEPAERTAILPAQSQARPYAGDAIHTTPALARMPSANAARPNAGDRSSCLREHRNDSAAAGHFEAMGPFRLSALPRS